MTNEPQSQASYSEWSNPQAQYEAELSLALSRLSLTLAQANNKPLDIVFVQQTTASQRPYIQSARKATRDICNRISASRDLSKDSIRFGLITFRDDPHQDQAYCTQAFGFTSDINEMEGTLSSIVASGRAGGGPAALAQTAALANALNLEWAEDAAKIAILVTDCSLHGIGREADPFTESSRNDLLRIVVGAIAERGITLFVIACKPEHGHSNQKAVDFYKALVEITSGRVISPLTADELGHHIVGIIDSISTGDGESS